MKFSPAASRVGLVAVALSTALVVVALAVIPFLSPTWVAFEQGRTGVAELTGYPDDQLRDVTNQILADLVIGPPDFDARTTVLTLSAGPREVLVLTPPERAHMRDVRNVFVSFFATAAIALAILLGAFRLAGRRGSAWTRREAWRGVRAGALGLSIGTAVAGLIALLAFDLAFEVFHRLFFASGTYLFDPATSRLVQLFPDAFWSEAAIAVGALIVVLAMATAWLAGRRLRAYPVPAAAAPPDGAGQGLSQPPAPAEPRAVR